MRHVFALFLFFALVAMLVCHAERTLPSFPPSQEPIPVIIDTDAACEIDDLYAIALSLLCPDRLDIQGFVAAHFGDAGGPEGIEKSYRAILTVMKKAKMEGRFPVKKGSHPFRYSQQPEPSEGVDFIIEKAMEHDRNNPLWVVLLGPSTDIVNAYLIEPEIKERVVVFWHGRTRWPDKCWNFNAYNDLKAVRLLFKSDLPFILFDTGTHLYCPMKESKRRLAPYGDLGKFLHTFRLKSKWFQSPKKGFYDLGDIAAVVDPTLAKWEVVDAPGVNWDMNYTHDKTYGKIVRIYDIDRDGSFQLLYGRLADAFPKSPK